MLAEAQNHPVWNAATRLECFSSALRPELLDTTRSDDACTDEARRLLGYDAKIVETERTGLMNQEMVCGELFGGVCGRDPLINEINTYLWNLYMLARRHQIRRQKLPLFFSMKVTGHARTDHNLLTMIFGKGDLFGVLRLEEEVAAPEEADLGAVYALRRTVAGDRAIPASLHLLFRDLLKEARREAPHDEGFGVDTTFHDIIDAGRDHYAIRLRPDILCHARLSTKHRDVGLKKKADDIEEEEFAMGLSMGSEVEPTQPTAEVESLQDPEDMVSERMVPRASSDDFDSASSQAPSSTEMVPLVPPALPPPMEPPPDADPEEVSDSSGRSEGGVVEPGIFDFDVAPTSRAMCFLCNKKIEEGCFRFACYRFPKTSIRIKRFCHKACVALLPSGLHAKSLRSLDGFLCQPGMPENHYVALEDARDTLRGPSGASSSTT